jgi:hypothetical protein
LTALATWWESRLDGQRSERVVSELTIEGRARLDLDELSALSQLPPGTSSGELIGVSDSSFRIAIGSTGPLQGLEVSPSLEDHVRDHTHEPEKGSQWEGVATDGAGRVFVLQEHAGKARPSHVFVLSPTMDDLVAVIALEVDDGEADWKEKWREDKNARGEALVLLRDARILVIKQKDPLRLIEFGPAGSSSHGLGAARLLGRGDAFELEEGSGVQYEPLESWGVEAGEGGQLESINDAIVAGDELYVVSRSSRQIARLDVEVEPSDESLRVERSWDLPDEIGQPEGLVLLEGAVALVADDQEDDGSSRDNVFRLGTLR